jgi:hypothetical protein
VHTYITVEACMNVVPLSSAGSREDTGYGTASPNCYSST